MRQTVSRRFLALLHTRNRKCNAGAIRASRWLAPRVHFPSQSARSKERWRYSPASLAHDADHECRGVLSWCHIHTSLLVHLGSSGSLSSSRTILQDYVQRSSLKIRVTFLRIRALHSVWLAASSLIIKNFQKQASCFQEQEYVCLI